MVCESEGLGGGEGQGEKGEEEEYRCLFFGMIPILEISKI